LGFDSKDNAYFVYLGAVGKNEDNSIYFAGPVMVVTATAQNNYADWHLAYEKDGPYFSEFRVDPARLRQDGVLSIMAQREAPKGVYASELSVLDLKLSP
jgi:hypothetical protein